HSGIIEIYFASADVPPAIFILFYTVAAKVYLTIHNTPPAIPVLRYSSITEIHLSIPDIPPAIFILFYTVAAKINLSIRNAPPAITVMGHRICKRNPAGFHIPPTAFAIYDTLNHISRSSLPLAIPDIP